MSKINRPVPRKKTAERQVAIMKPKSVKRLRVVVFREGDWLCAQSVDYALGVQARTLPELYRAFYKVIAGHIIVRGLHKMRPFADLPSAPQKYREMFARAVELESPIQAIKLGANGIRIPPPRIRIDVATAPAA